VRLALHRDAVGLAVRRAGDAVVALERMLSRHFDPEGQVLPRLVAQDGGAVFGPQHKGGDDLALLVLALDPEVAPAIWARRWIAPSIDIAGLVAYVASPESHFVTGALLNIDGGYTI
jgi:NAD(P)-dependent dehydrogenase (short-subunit alcohol dehydrogenase family)